MSDEDRLTPEEESALSGLAMGSPPAGIEDRVVEALRRRGLVRRLRAEAGWRLTAAAAIALLLFTGGYMVGRHSAVKKGVAPTGTVESPVQATTEQGVTQVVWF